MRGGFFCAGSGAGRVTIVTEATVNMKFCGDRREAKFATIDLPRATS
jgi:hypothetical protein